ncbi:MAG TPA: hypothetical protein DEA46_05645 [Candidatus Moranbacteria bacterium]|nr:hypothetical protein [Candidatus Moranbacteria bacterium]
MKIIFGNSAGRKLVLNNNFLTNNNMDFEQPPKPSTETIVGAKKNPDGTMDYSQAATFKISEEQAEKLSKSAEERK